MRDRTEYFKNYWPKYRKVNKERLKVNSFFDRLSSSNITAEQYNNLMEKQSNRCAICNIHHSELRLMLHIDHDHKCCPGKSSCGKCIRGLICSYCNKGLGMFRDRPELLQKAILYLRVSL